MSNAKCKQGWDKIIVPTNFYEASFKEFMRSLVGSENLVKENIWIKILLFFASQERQSKSGKWSASLKVFSSKI